MEIIAIALIVGLLLGRTLRSSRKQGRAAAEPEEPTPVTEAGPEEKRENLRSKILEIIRSAEEGITLPQLGEKMHRHFAPLIGPVRLLLEEGVIKREGGVYKIVEK